MQQEEGEYPQPHAIYAFTPIRRTMIQTLNMYRNREPLNYHPFRFTNLYKHNPTNLTKTLPAPIYGNMHFFITPRERSGNGFKRTVEGEGVWVESGDAVDVFDEDGLSIGCMRCFWFCVGDGGEATKWRMVEYSLPEGEYVGDDDGNDGFEAACTVENMENYGGVEIGTVLQWEGDLDL